MSAGLEGRTAAGPCSALQKASATSCGSAWSGYKTSMVEPVQVLREGAAGRRAAGGRDQLTIVTACMHVRQTLNRRCDSHSAGRHWHSQAAQAAGANTGCLQLPKLDGDPSLPGLHCQNHSLTYLQALPVGQQIEASAVSAFAALDLPPHWAHKFTCRQALRLLQTTCCGMHTHCCSGCFPPIKAGAVTAGNQQPPAAHVAAAAAECGPGGIVGRLRHALVVPVAFPAAAAARCAGVAGESTIQAGAKLSAVAPLSATLAPEVQDRLRPKTCTRQQRRLVWAGDVWTGTIDWSPAASTAAPSCCKQPTGRYPGAAPCATWSRQGAVTRRGMVAKAASKPRKLHTNRGKLHPNRFDHRPTSYDAVVLFMRVVDAIGAGKLGSSIWLLTQRHQRF